MAGPIQRTKHLIKYSEYNRFIPFKFLYYLRMPPRGLDLPELNAAFMPVNKVAMRSIKTVIADHLGMDYEIVHSADWNVISKAEIASRNCFTFSFVRHPLDRLVSCYSHKVFTYGQYSDVSILFWMYGKSFSRDMSFEAFVHTVAKIPDAVSDPHFRSQHCFLYHRDQRVCDFLGRFENLQYDWQKVCDKLGVELLLPHENKSAHRPWQEMYSAELIQVASKRYRKDMEFFGYSIEGT